MKGCKSTAATGYSMEFEAQRFWRDARTVLSIFEGTSEIQLEVVSKRIMEREG